MKFIISHDIDHFYWSDHFFKDLFIPKYILKNTLYLAKGQIPLTLYLARIRSFSSNRFGRLEELVEFNRKNEVPGCYFMGVRNALNLSYSETTAAAIASFLYKKKCPLYLHGIAYEDIDEMRAEKDTFQNLVPTNKNHGIRMHYLRNSSQTLNNISDLHYLFDSTLYELRDPFFINDLIEFPVSMMEVYMMEYNDTDFEKIKKATLERIEKAHGAGLRYFTVIFHDHHFSESFPLHKKWYEWLIEYLKNKRYEFIDFETACNEVRVAHHGKK
jgi:hypothetical protein